MGGAADRPTIAGMYGQRGEFFFHFTTAEAAFELILPDRLLRLSPHQALRDPLEYKEWEFGDFGGAYWTASLGDESPLRILAEATKALNAIRKQVKVLALTVDPPGYEKAGKDQLFGRGYASARMWEHYADNHAGVCLVFDRTRLEAELGVQLTRHHPLPGMTKTLFRDPVKYTTAGWAGAGARNLALTEEIVRPEAAGEQFEANVREMLFLKTRDWATEYEYRYAAVTPGHEYEYVHFGGSLRAVIVGERFPAWQAAGAIELCLEAGAEAKRLTFLKEGPVVVPLTSWTDLEPHERERSRKLRHGSGALPPTT
jgi:hypothetical protein